MRDICLDAKQVVVWLGEEGTAQCAIDMCKYLQQQEDDYLFTIDEAARHAEGFQACDDLFNKRPWWKRTWIIQEVYHRNPVLVHIGKLRIGLDDLFDMWSEYLTQSQVIDYLHDVDDPPYSQLLLHFMRIIPHPTYTLRRERARLEERLDDLHNLSVLTGLFRGQEASDPRDKIFALVGISTGKCGIKADYNLKLPEVYVRVTRMLLEDSLYLLLQVDSLNRPVPPQEFPSWVPDYSTTQQSVAWHMAFLAPEFAAAPPKREYSVVDCFANGEEENSIFCLQEVYVAIVIGVHEITQGANNIDCFRLIRYDDDPGKRDGAFEYEEWPLDASEITILNTSWAPHATQLGDIIVVADGCPIPLVLRKSGAFYFVLGGCWLIDSKLESDFPHLIRSDPWLGGESHAVESPSARLRDDPGFSDVMRGSVWGNGNSGKESIWDSAREVFKLR